MSIVYLHFPKEIKSTKELNEAITFDKNLYLCCSQIVSRKEEISKIFGSLKTEINEYVCFELMYHRVTMFEKKNSVLTKPSRKFDSIIENYYKNLYKDIIENEFIYSHSDIPSYAKVNKKFRL